MRNSIVALAVSLFGIGLVAAAPQAGAVNLFDRCTSADQSQCTLVKEDKLDYKGTNSIWRIVQFALGILGGIAVIMIVVGGIKYTLSAGDSSQLTSAKNTILYSVVGLVVALLASGIVLLVTEYFT